MTLEELLRRPDLSLADLTALEPGLGVLPPGEAEELSLETKYAGYIARARDEADRLRAFENRPLPPDLDYAAVPNLSGEAVEKLARIRPESLGQAGRISGISPTDLLALLVHLRKRP